MQACRTGTIWKNSAHVKLMEVKVQGRATGKRIGESYFNFLGQLSLMPGTFEKYCGFDIELRMGAARL